jgi:hypothetical protein
VREPLDETWTKNVKTIDEWSKLGYWEPCDEMLDDLI